MTSGRTEYYTCDPEEGLEVYDSAEQAEGACRAYMQVYADIATSEGWPECMEALEWGRLVPHARAQCVRRERPTDEHPDGAEEWGLRAVEDLPSDKR